MNEQDIGRYEKMLAEDPNSRAFAPLADAYRKAGKLDDAIRVAESGVRRHPGYGGGLVVLGRALLEAGELGRASEFMERAVKETPENYLAQKTMGRIAKARGDNQRALAAFKAANFLSPEDKEVEGEIRILEGKVYRPDGLDLPPEPSGAREPELVTAPGRSSGKAAGGSPEEDTGPDGNAGNVEDTGEQKTDRPGNMAPLTEGIGTALDDGEDPENYYMTDSAPEVSDESGVPEFVQELTAVADGSGHGTPAAQEPPAEKAVEQDNPPGIREAEPAPMPDIIQPPEGEELSTETLADLYAQQGLTDKAVQIYGQLLDERPDDKALRGKLHALTREGTEAVAEAPSGKGDPGSGHDPVAALEGWLRNAERMKRR